jgi:hypothetical protein
MSSVIPQIADVPSDHAILYGSGDGCTVSRDCRVHCASPRRGHSGGRDGSCGIVCLRQRLCASSRLSGARFQLAWLLGGRLRKRRPERRLRIDRIGDHAGLGMVAGCQRKRARLGSSRCGMTQGGRQRPKLLLSARPRCPSSPLPPWPPA